MRGAREVKPHEFKAVQEFKGLGWKEFLSEEVVHSLTVVALLGAAERIPS